MLGLIYGKRNVMVCIGLGNGTAAASGGVCAGQRGHVEIGVGQRFKPGQ